MSRTALAGVRVLELANFVAAPLAARVLGDLGATVYKVERPKVGDDARRFPPHLDGEGSFFIQCNRNKESVAVDLGEERGRILVRRLAGECDVLITNYRAGALQRLGLDYASLRDECPRLVYCSISGYGAFGPDADRAAYDRSIQALSGLMWSSGSDDERPLGVGPAITDNAAATWAVVGILAALRERDQTGGGQHVDSSLIGAAMDIMANDIHRFDATGARPRRGRADSMYRARDGGWIQLAIGNDAIFQRACQVLDRADLADDERFVSATARSQHSAELNAALSSGFGAKTAIEWEAKLNRSGVSAAAVRDIGEVLATDWLVEGRLESYESHGRKVLQVRTPVEFEVHEAQVRTRPPALGQGTRHVLDQVLQIPSSEIDGLALAGVIECAPEPSGAVAEPSH